MTRRRLLTIVSILFALITTVLGICEFFGSSYQVVRLIPVFACLMLVTGGLNRFIDKRKDGIVSLVVGLFLALVAVVTFLRV